VLVNGATVHCREVYMYIFHVTEVKSKMKIVIYNKIATIKYFLD